MKIEKHKHYRNRAGGKCYVIADDGTDVPFFVYHHDGNKGWHRIDGSHNCGKIKYDLVAEWVEEETKAVPIISAESIDSITKDSLRHHFKEGKDMEPLQREAFRIVMRYYGVNDV
jgi:hypothetical protein